MYSRIPINRCASASVCSGAHTKERKCDLPRSSSRTYIVMHAGFFHTPRVLQRRCSIFNLLYHSTAFHASGNAATLQSYAILLYGSRDPLRIPINMQSVRAPCRRIIGVRACVCVCPCCSTYVVHSAHLHSDWSCRDCAICTCPCLSVCVELIRVA